MSANNYMLIVEVDNGYTVGMVDAGTGTPLGKALLYKTLKLAILAAQREKGVEYGLHFIFEEKDE